MKPRKKSRKDIAGIRSDGKAGPKAGAGEILADGSCMDNPTVDGPVADLKQIDAGRRNNTQVIWGSKFPQDSDYTGDECDTFNDR